MNEEDLIAPCGMNCRLCVAFQARELDINKQGFRRTYCPGCIPRGEHCLHMADRCEKVGKGLVRFCIECEDYPCKRLKSLDKRYRDKYHMSMIENLDSISENGMTEFLRRQEDKWRCPNCGGTICCHNGLCLSCDLERWNRNRKYRWGEE
jgi:hypothetical protein